MIAGFPREQVIGSVLTVRRNEGYGWSEPIPALLLRKATLEEYLAEWPDHAPPPMFTYFYEVSVD